MTAPVIHRVTTLDLRVEPWRGRLPTRGAPISTRISRQQREKPKLWNGRVLLGRNPVFSPGRFSASYFETDFASFLAWRDWGFPDHDVFNGFGMGALLCADGAFVLGEMGEHTVECRAHLFSVRHARSRRYRRHARHCRQRHARARGGDRADAGRLSTATRTGIASTRAGDRDDPDPEGRYAGRSACARASRPISRGSGNRNCRRSIWFARADISPQCRPLSVASRSAVRNPTLTCRWPPRARRSASSWRCNALDIRSTVSM